jgi:hypothetical protein
LWYLCDEIAVFAIFDDEVDDEVKMKMVSNLECEKSFDVGKRYIPSKEEISNSLYGKALLQLRVFSLVLIKFIYLICDFSR